MRKFAGLLIVIGFVFFGTYSVYALVAHYQWDNQVYSYWTLSDRSSTLAAKEQNMDKFVEKLGSVTGSAALVFQKPNNDCQNNLTAVQTLQKRLHDIQGMDENSFAYQTAIQQITEQEQGQASDMTDVLFQCWIRENYYVVWNPIVEGISLLGGLMLMVLGLLLLFLTFNYEL